MNGERRKEKRERDLKEEIQIERKGGDKSTHTHIQRKTRGK